MYSRNGKTVIAWSRGCKLGGENWVSQGPSVVCKLTEESQEANEELVAVT